MNYLYEDETFKVTNREIKIGLETLSMDHVISVRQDLRDPEKSSLYTPLLMCVVLGVLGAIFNPLGLRVACIVTGVIGIAGFVFLVYRSSGDWRLILTTTAGERELLKSSPGGSEDPNAYLRLVALRKAIEKAIRGVEQVEEGDNEEAI